MRALGSEYLRSCFPLISYRLRVLKTLYFCKIIKKNKKKIGMIFCEWKKKLHFGTSDAWSMNHLPHQPSSPVYYIQDCWISPKHVLALFVTHPWFIWCFFQDYLMSQWWGNDPSDRSIHDKDLILHINLHKESFKLPSTHSEDDWNLILTHISKEWFR